MEMLAALSSRVQELLDVKEVTDPELFLKTVLKDFTFYTQGE